MLAAVGVAAAVGLVGGVLVYERQQTQLARQKLDEVQRGSDARDMVRQAQEAVDKQDWHVAQLPLIAALAKIGSDDGSLEELRARAQDLMNQVERGLQGQERRQRAVSRYQEFLKGHDDTLFHATLATGEGLAANVQATREKAQATLAQWGVALAARTPLTLAEPLTDGEKGEVLAGCYELLLVWAESAAQSLQGEEPRTQREEALRILDRASTLGCSAHPTQAYHLRRARYLEALGQGEAARQERERAAAHPPATALDYYLVGDEQFKQDHVAEAVSDFENALGLQPDRFWARYFVSVGYLRLGRSAEAKAGLTACLSQQPRFVWIYLLRGFAHSQLNEFDAARADFQKALELNPTPEARHVLYANRAVLWFQQGKFAEAEADLRQAIELRPQEYQAYVTLAQVLQRQDKWAEAIAQIDRAIAVEPKLAFLYRLRGRLRAECPAHDLAAALGDYEKAIQVEKPTAPASVRARDQAERGRILHRRQEFAAAVAAYDAALQIEPGYANAYLGRAEAQLQLRHYAEAARSLGDYLKAGGRPREEIYRARARAYAELGKYREAVADYTLALQAKPDEPALRAARGWAYLACRAYDLALADFDEAVRLDGKNAEVYTGRGFARANCGQCREAIRDAEEALKRGPRTPRLCYDAARIFAEVVGRMDADPGLRERQRLQRRSEYEARALSLVRDLVRLPPDGRSPSWRDRILRDDRALDPIRRSPGFATVQQESLQAAP
jgi:tetratricopeptide (TPR) repeat protein